MTGRLQCSSLLSRRRIPFAVPGQRMQISYSTGWNIIRRLETELGRTLVERSQGGLGGGQSRLTGDGLRLLEKYNEFERRLREEGDRLFQDCFGELL